MSENAYWTCRIGPADRDKLPDDADSPLRAAVASAFVDVTGAYAETLSSGWGRKEDDSARLGLATTYELLEELRARGTVSATVGEYPAQMGSMAMRASELLDSLPGPMLAYRTVDRS